MDIAKGEMATYGILVTHQLRRREHADTTKRATGAVTKMAAHSALLPNSKRGAEQEWMDFQYMNRN